MPDAEIEKAPKTPEELAAIAYLDKLRACEGEAMPVGLPLACVVKVVAYEEIPKAGEQYAMATVEGRDGRTWRLCIRRYYLEGVYDKKVRALVEARPCRPPMPPV